MNNKIAKIIKDNYLVNLTWKDKLAGLVQTANIRVQGTDGVIDKSYPISCDIDADACKKGAYQDLAPDSKKMSVMYFEDQGGVPFIERIGNRLKFNCKLRLVIWLNLRVIADAVCDGDVVGCGVSGDYVIEVIKILPHVPFSTADFVSINITNISQVERSVAIFSRYTYNETATQYLMFPYDYAALDLDIDFTIPCVPTNNVVVPVPEPEPDVIPDNALLNEDGTPLLNEDGSYILNEI